MRKQNRQTKFVIVIIIVAVILIVGWLITSRGAGFSSITPLVPVVNVVASSQ